jgi:hypothetical protein
MRKRDPRHPLSCLTVRASDHPEKELCVKQKAICLNFDKFGLNGTIEKVDYRNGTVSMSFDVKNEESKVHDPFLGQKLIKLM